MSIEKTTDSSSLAEVIDRILDKGIVIDAYARVSLVGIEILTVEARVVIASVDTWLRYAEAVGLLRDEREEEGLLTQGNEREAQYA
ncbi:gas vesicle structural protein GvpA [Lentibacillus sediminis]|uniref:gas vesicle structural protein GvpA n=1 Tax=Lentibacillus sediminis TaxID=1940529 RepID=UPI000C1B98AF|nr:gas vesicle structural protein GvpA [Lentibacillus sediminis]